MPAGNVEILHALKCVLGAPKVLFRACKQYIYIPASCCLRLAASDQCTGP